MGASGTLTNLGTGDLTLGGAVSNSGIINLNGSGSACGDVDAILIRSSVAATQRAWSGTGVLTLKDVDVQDQGGTATITVYSGTAGTGNGANWTFDSLCPTITQAASRWFNNADSADVGSALAAQDTAATAPAQGTPFRLRTLLHGGTTQLGLRSHALKLQVAVRSGSCDAGFVGETYADVSPSSGAIRYYNNATPADGAALTANANDPAHGADTIVNQTYEEANHLTMAQAAIPAGQDGKWDFALVEDASASASDSYCFRLIQYDGTVLDTYSVMPELTKGGRVPRHPGSVGSPAIY